MTRTLYSSLALLLVAAVVTTPRGAAAQEVSPPVAYLTFEVPPDSVRVNAVRIPYEAGERIELVPDVETRLEAFRAGFAPWSVTFTPRRGGVRRYTVEWAEESRAVSARLNTAFSRKQLRYPIASGVLYGALGVAGTQFDGGARFMAVAGATVFGNLLVTLSKQRAAPHPTGRLRVSLHGFDLRSHAGALRSRAELLDTNRITGRSRSVQRYLIVLYGLDEVSGPQSLVTEDQSEYGLAVQATLTLSPGIFVYLGYVRGQTVFYDIELSGRVQFQGSSDFGSYAESGELAQHFAELYVVAQPFVAFGTAVRVGAGVYRRLDGFSIEEAVRIDAALRSNPAYSFPESNPFLRAQVGQETNLALFAELGTPLTSKITLLNQVRYYVGAEPIAIENTNAGGVDAFVEGDLLLWSVGLGYSLF